MVQVLGDSPDDDGVVGRASVSGKSGVFGNNPVAGGNGVAGISVDGNGVYAKSTSLNGLYGESDTGSGVHGHSVNQTGVYAVSDAADGMQAVANSGRHAGIFGQNLSVGDADSPGGSGVFGLTVAAKAAGVFGANNHVSSGVGVQGNGPEAGVSGFSEAGAGVLGHSNRGDGMQAFAHSGDHNGLLGLNDAKAATGKSGAAPTGNGVYGYTDVATGSGVCGAIPGSNTAGAGLTGIGPVAGRFFGDVVVTGDIQLTGADYAEDFEIRDVDAVEPGTVMVLDAGGSVRVSQQPYDGRVAGVVAGAGHYRSAVILDRQPDLTGRQPLALMGKVMCKVDASKGAVEVGDMLTTSDIPGYAMKATDRERAFGSIIGKALMPLAAGRGLLPILVSLQ